MASGKWEGLSPRTGMALNSLSLSSSLNGQLQVDCLQSAFSQNPSSSYLIQRDCKPRCYYLGTDTYESREGSSDFRLPTSNFQLLTFDFRLPTSNFQLLTSDFRHPTFRLPTSDLTKRSNYGFLISDCSDSMLHGLLPCKFFTQKCFGTF